MSQQQPPDLEMTIEGEFVSPPQAPIANRLLLWAMIIAVTAGAVCLAAFALWIALLFLPVAIGAGVIAWAMYRYRMWRMEKEFGGQRGVSRP